LREVMMLTWKSLRHDLRTHLLEAPERRRLPMLIARLSKYAVAALFYHTGLTGALLRRTLRSRNACLILGFHGTTDAEPGYFSPGHAIANVHDQLRYLRRHLRQVSLGEIAVAIGRGDAPPSASFTVTFDDGLANNARFAIPALRDLGLAATFFIPSSLIGSAKDLWVLSLRELVRGWRGESVPGTPGLWPALSVSDEASRYAAFFRIKETLKVHEARRKEILDRLAAEAGEQVRPPEADRVMGRDVLMKMIQPPLTVGAHSRSHPILSGLDRAQCEAEVAGSRADLEQMLGRPVLDFAYPNGRFPDFDDTTRTVVAEAGFRCAVTTEPGMVKQGDDRLALRRCLPGNVPAFLAGFDLLSRAWADRGRPGDGDRPLEGRISYLVPRGSRPVH